MKRGILEKILNDEKLAREISYTLNILFQPSIIEKWKFTKGFLNL